MSKNKNYFSNINYPYSDGWNKNKNYMTITVQNVHYSFANGLRRSIISMIPTIGFRALPYENSTIDILENDTYLNNEIIKHRISMIPLFIDDDFDYEDLEFILDEENATNIKKYITTEHFKIRRISTDTFLKKEEVKKILPPCDLTGDYIIIVKLKPKHYTDLGIINQDNIAKNINIPVSKPIRLKLKARLVKSTSLENGHFSPVCTCTYGYSVDKKVIKQAEDEYVNSVNEKNRALGLSDIDTDILRRRFKINELQRYPIKDEYGEPCSFDFTIESIGQYKPLKLINLAIVYLINDIDTLINDLKLKNDERLKIELSESQPNGLNIYVNNMDDTLGNIIHCHMINNLCAYHLGDNRKLESFTYNKIHPLKREILFTLNTISISTDNVIEEVLIPELKNISKLYTDILNNLKSTYI